MNLSLLLAFKPVRVICFSLFLFIANNGYAQTPTLTTDEPDYPPGSTVTLSGQCFQPGETVTMQVLHFDASGDNSTSAEHAPWTVTADANGNFTTTWYIPLDEDEFGATLKATADGQNSGLHAE